MSNFLRWWLLFCLTAVAMFIAYNFGFVDALLAKDKTYLSFVIITIFVFNSFYVGWLTWQQKTTGSGIKFSWFVTELLLAIGMIGTVIGFILMLGNSFETLNVTDTGSVKTALQDMALGMSTALYTTLVGLICSQTLKVQLVNAES